MSHRLAEEEGGGADGHHRGVLGPVHPHHTDGALRHPSHRSEVMVPVIKLHLIAQ